MTKLVEEKRTTRPIRPVLIEGGYILELTNPVGHLQGADVLVENGTITQIASHGTIESPTARRLDGRGCLILPGLTNAHTHSPENFAAGFCDALRLESWLNAVWARLDHLSPEEIRLGVTLGVAQMLKQGVTAIVDHFRQTPISFDAIDIALAAYECTGVRAIVAVMLRDRLDKDGRLIGAPTGGEPLSPPAMRDLWTEVAKRHRPQSRVAIALGPSGPTRCTDAMFEVAAEIAREHSLYLHTHVAETRSEADAAQEMYGCRMVRHLDDLGFLGPRTSLAHCVWIDDEEVDLISRSGAVVVHNPISNMALGSGIAPVNSMISASAHVAIGTDGAASNGAQNIWESVKCAALLGRCGTREPADWLTAHQALMLAVKGGRELFGIRPSAIAENTVADVAVFPIRGDTLEEFFDPVRTLVYGAQSRARHVLVSGDPVLIDGKIASFDESVLEAELLQIRSKSIATQLRRPIDVALQ
jgi:5-methylthioadenosine/S-adenosylhomocysteine deaminase